MAEVKCTQYEIWKLKRFKTLPNRKQKQNK